MTPSQLKVVKQAERQFWEGAFYAAFSNDHDLETGKHMPELCFHAASSADHALTCWRERFCPEREHAPIEGEF